MAQVVECLPSKGETLNSAPINTHVCMHTHTHTHTHTHKLLFSHPSPQGPGCRTTGQGTMKKKKLWNWFVWANSSPSQAIPSYFWMSLLWLCIESSHTSQIHCTPNQISNLSSTPDPPHPELSGWQLPLADGQQKPQSVTRSLSPHLNPSGEPIPLLPK
jgi:hypothetical protein